MLEKALNGSKLYWTWIVALLIVIAAGFGAYLVQFNKGLVVTGMSRDVSWGFYIAQFTFLVGVAASAVMLVLPYYAHHYKTFGRITILGEFLAISAVIMCILFITVDLGKPTRILNVMLHPTPNSILFWDMIVLNGYLFINLIAGWVTLESERKNVPPPGWIKVIIYLSIPWAVSHPHGHGVPVCRSAWPRLLADRHTGPPIPGLGLRGRPRGAHPVGLSGQEAHPLRPRTGGLRDPGQDRVLRHHAAYFLFPAGSLHRGLQQHPQPPVAHEVPLLRTARVQQAGGAGSG